MKPKYIIGIGVIVVFMGFAAISFQSSLTPYVAFAEAKTSGRTVQVKGATIQESAQYNMDTKTFNFKLVDDRGDELQVMYNGVKPSNFERATEVVAKGRYQNGVFMADELLGKCPSKYEAEGVHGVEGEQS